MLRSRLKADLRAALKVGSTDRVDAIRTLMAAISNAEAIELDASHPKGVQGWAEAPRRRLTVEQIAEIVRREARELRAAAAEFEGHGEAREAARLRGRAEFIERYSADLL